MPNSVWDVALLTAVQLVSGGRCPLEIQAVAKSSQGATSRAHELSASDMIYQQEDFKAIYYQNQKIIELLKQFGKARSL